MEFVIEYFIGLVQAYPYGALALAILGTLDVVVSTVVKLTTTVKDDEWLNKVKEHKIFGPILKALEKFSYFDIKGKPKK